MKDNARVIVTYDCPRNCPNCCNEHIDDVPEVNFEDLLNYKELVITGGEPMEIAPRVVEMLHRIRANGYEGKIWLYTSGLKTSRWICEDLFSRPPKLQQRWIYYGTYIGHGSVNW